ncbi:MAG: hypothetical protein JKY52_00075 [Flavobacteriales bacterium]|nr:hypothetical protein [Flavobacteriales bacterium]
MKQSSVDKKFKGVIPYDPVEDVYYINAIGSNEEEAELNFHDTICGEYELFKRLKFVPVKIEVMI